MSSTKTLAILLGSTSLGILALTALPGVRQSTRSVDGGQRSVPAPTLPDVDTSVADPLTPSPANTSQAPITVDAIDLEEEMVQPIPTVEELFEELDLEFDSEHIALGGRLFRDPILSVDGTVSCASCHDIEFGRIQEVVTARALRSSIDGVPTTEILLRSFPLHGFWIDRDEAEDTMFDDEELGPLLEDHWEAVLERLAAHEDYPTVIPAALEDVDSMDDLDYELICDAIEDFTRVVRTPESPFDRYLRGDQSAVPLEVKQGYQLFKDLACVSCHFGASLGGRAFMKMGTARNYFGLKPLLSINDLGRFNVTGDERDKFVFRVPTLRNVALTAPYFHDDSQATLEEATRAMLIYQLGLDPNRRQVELLVHFLNALTSEIDGQAISNKNVQNAK